MRLPQQQHRPATAHPASRRSKGVDSRCCTSVCQALQVQAPVRQPTLDIRIAKPVEYWACADVACRTFYDSPVHHADDSQPAGVAMPRKPWIDIEAALPSEWQSALHAFKRVSQRVDCVQCMHVNDSIQRAGHGRTAMLIACTATASAQQPAQTADHSVDSSTQHEQQGKNLSAPGTSQPLILATEALGAVEALAEAGLQQRMTTALTPFVAPTSRSGVGMPAEDYNMLAVANLDNFGDRVPARTLDVFRDNAMGWSRREGIAYVCNVAVLPSARRQGVARALMESTEALARDWGCRAIGLHCNPKNVAAMQLYLRMGYRRTPALEDPWTPWLMGRGPDRCQFLLKRLPAAQAAQVPV